ncbi:uncharacterized protein LOC131294246 [Anopheles ziemanni]|uniref:uncharacterized protein LOC131264941 n=1 Tax=Anopheles coustani TaxID=139045 RepID=UPI00265835AF|nr:uncharacterized protein LOC131264941 [Anopheles coustani]XP_058178274.1 uncharacterized protein LOC131294246 [Anopheles ziemanni]
MNESDSFRKGFMTELQVVTVKIVKKMYEFRETTYINLKVACDTVALVKYTPRTGHQTPSAGQQRSESAPRPDEHCSSPTLSFAGQFDIGPEISTTVGANYKLAEHDVTNVRSVSVRPTDTGLPVYIVARLENNKLTLTTSDQFANFEKLDEKLVFFNVVVFNCQSGTVREMTYRQNILEENNYDPLFSREVYDIKVPLPLPRDFNLIQFVDDGKGIVANDYDITKNTVTFSIDENDYFTVSSSRGSSRTEFIGNLITKQTLTKIQPISLQIYAEDEWNPPRKSQARLTISGDPVIVYITPPEFEQSLYKISYKLGNTFEPIRVNLVAGSYDTTVQYLLSGDDSTYFTVTPTADRGSATLTLRSGTQVDKTKTILSVTVSATRTGTDSIGRTALVVDVASDLAFEQTLYTGSISTERVISLDAAIRLIPSAGVGTVTVQLTGDDAKYFAATLTNNQVSITRSALLTDAVVKEKYFFLVGIQAEKASVDVGETLLVLSVAKTNLQVPQFEQPVYEGTVTEAGVVSVPTVKISSDSLVSGLTFSYTGDVDLFSITASPTTGTISIVPNGITPEKLADKSYLLVTVTGKLGDVDAAHAVIVMRVVRAAIVLPKFSKPYLEGQLLEKTLELRVPNVELAVTSFSTSTEIKLTDALGFFAIQEFFPPNVFQVFLRGNVTSESLRGIDRIPLTVEAKNPNSEAVYCVITVDVVRVTPPAFERLIYEGVIDDSKLLVESITAKLTSETLDETVQYSLDGTDAAYFLLDSTTTDGVSVKLRAALTDSEFESRDMFQFSLKATKQLAASDAIVPVVVYIKRPLVKIPKFEKPLYKSRVNSELQLVPFETIVLEPGTYLNTATISIQNSNSDLFGVTLQQQGVVTIRLLKELDQATVNGLDRFEFILECTNPAMASGFATIVIDIDRAVDPEFTQFFYTGEVQQGAKEIVFDRNIMLRSETISTGTTYNIQGVDSALVRYVVSSTDQTLGFFLRDEVTVEQLKTRSDLSFAVVATNPRSNKPAVTSCSVKINREPQPSFTQSSFQGKIVEGQTLVNFGDAPIAWEPDTVTAATIFTIVSSSPADFFEVAVTEDLRTATVRLRSEVRWDQVRSHLYFKLVLQAVTPGAQAAECTLLVEVENQPTITPAFTKSIYRGSLQQGTKEVIFSAAETITVKADTMMETFQYVTSSEDDAALFDVALVDGNKLKVSLKEAVDASSIEGRDLLSFNININNQYSAVDTATVVITIKLDDIISPTFGKLLYSGAITEGTQELRLEETIQLSVGTYTDNTEVGIGGADAKYFTLTRTGARIEMTLVGSLDWSELTSTGPGGYLSVYIQATNPGSDTATAFVLIDIEQIQQPQFAQAAVHGHLEGGSLEVIFIDGSELKIVSGSTEPGLQWNLAGDDYLLFDGSLNDDLFKFRLKDTVTAAQLGSRTLFQFSVTLKNPNSGTVEASVIVNRKLPTPLFTKPVYYGAFDGDLRLSLVDVVELTEGSFTFGTLITAVETNVDFLAVEQSERRVEMALTRALTLDDFRGLQVVHVALEARINDDVKGTCSVLLTVPEGTPCVPLPPIVDCTSCYNCTTGGVEDDVPVFPYGNFRYQLRRDTRGPIGSVTATAKDPSAIVEHQLEITDEYLKTFISITPEGTLSLLQPIVPNVYSFLVHATNTVARKQSSASVLLNVLNAYECTEGDKQVTVDQSLYVQHLDEERAHTTIFPTQLDTACTYELLSEHPTGVLQPYFYIDTETNWLASRSFDRENRELFGDMMVPQFRLQLQLRCDTERQQTATRSLVKRSLVETESINYAPDLTVISIIVDDINDNDPVFVQPPDASGGTIHLGYPEPSLATRLMLAQLTRIQATDVDEGLNAKIRYSLVDSAGHFVVDPEEGLVYPTSDALRETNEVEIVAIATDRDGASDGRSTRLPMVVHRLASDQIAIVSYTLIGGTTWQDLVDQINRQDNFKVQLLHQAYVPSSEPSQTERRSARQALESRRPLRLVVYAFDNNNQPMDTDSIRSGIRRAVPSIDDTAIVSFGEAVCSTDPNYCADGLSGSNVGLIASTSVLGALFAISLAIGSVLYVRYVRPLSKNANSDPSDVEQLENDFDPSPPSTPPAKREQEPTILEEVQGQDRKISINIAGITMQESVDDHGEPHRLARTLTDRLEEEDEYGASSSDTFGSAIPSSEPKNVKFNEVVERIEVQEHHSDNEDNDDDDGGGDDAIYEERL